MEVETSAHILGECEALASFRHVYLGSIFLGAGGYSEYKLGGMWNFSNATGLP